MKFNFETKDINYIKISYIDAEDNLYSIKAILKEVNKTSILVCIKSNEQLNLLKQQDVKVNIVCKDGLYQADSKIISIEEDVPYNFIRLEKPEDVDYLQNREYFRINAVYPCLYKVNQENINRDFETQTIDISANGVSIFMPIFVKSEPSSHLELNIENKKLKIKAQYVRIEKWEDGYKISFSYNNISESDRDYISQICLKKQLEEKRKHLQ